MSYFFSVTGLVIITFLVQGDCQSDKGVFLDERHDLISDPIVNLVQTLYKSLVIKDENKTPLTNYKKEKRKSFTEPLESSDKKYNEDLVFHVFENISNELNIHGNSSWFEHLERLKESFSFGLPTPTLVMQ